MDFHYHALVLMSRAKKKKKRLEPSCWNLLVVAPAKHLGEVGKVPDRLTSRLEEEQHIDTGGVQDWPDGLDVLSQNAIVLGRDDRVRRPMAHPRFIGKNLHGVCG